MPKPGIDSEAKELFLKTVARLSGHEEVVMFFQDFFSSAEVKDFSRRLMAAKLLRKRETYLEINKVMGMSAGTINKIYFKTRGSRLLDSLLD